MCTNCGLGERTSYVACPAYCAVGRQDVEGLAQAHAALRELHEELKELRAQVRPGHGVRRYRARPCDWGSPGNGMQEQARAPVLDHAPTIFVGCGDRYCVLCACPPLRASKPLSNFITFLFIDSMGASSQFGCWPVAAAPSQGRAPVPWRH